MIVRMVGHALALWALWRAWRTRHEHRPDVAAHIEVVVVDRLTERYARVADDFAAFAHVHATLPAPDPLPDLARLNYALWRGSL